MDSPDRRMKHGHAEDSVVYHAPMRSDFDSVKEEFDDESPREEPRAESERIYHDRRPAGREDLRAPLDSEKAQQAIEQGRRLYVGNLRYEVTVKDVQRLFSEVADGIESINSMSFLICSYQFADNLSVSVDPITGRNPSYCFVDFTTKELAERVMRDYDGQLLLHRPIRVKFGVKYVVLMQHSRIH